MVDAGTLLFRAMKSQCIVTFDFLCLTKIHSLTYLRV